MQTTTICKVKATPSICFRPKSTISEQQKACNQEKSPIISAFLMIPFEEKIHHRTKVSNNCNIKSKKISKPTNGLKFPEMRNGILFTRCHCVHRDGLQDSCPLSQCQQESDCLVKPWPKCPPAKYLQSRHPEQYPPFK